MNEEDFEYLFEQQKSLIESDIGRLEALTKYLGIDSRDRLELTLEFAKLFNRCNANGWINIKGDY